MQLEDTFKDTEGERERERERGGRLRDGSWRQRENRTERKN